MTKTIKIVDCEATRHKRFMTLAKPEPVAWMELAESGIFEAPVSLDS
jgi:hypothetical protein